MILEGFEDEINTPAYKQVPGATTKDSEGNTSTGNPTYDLIDDCFFYEGSIGRTNIADMIRQQMTASAIFYPSAQSSLSGVEVLRIEGDLYQILSTDDIARQGEVIFLPLKKIGKQN
jgi:hypothetical protein